MAAGLQNRFNAAQDPNFQAKVAEAVAEAAIAIYNEGTGVAGHAARARLATQAINSPASLTPAFSSACATQGVDNTSTDAQISAAIASTWNVIAGA